MVDGTDAAGTATPRVSSETSVESSKQSIRQEMRALRRALTDRTERSTAMWSTLLERPEVVSADRVMVFDSIPGEPETAMLVEMLHAAGKQTALPEDADLEPAWPDVIVVPGLAFTHDGRRLGQGGGWYDRFLPGRRSECVTIGVCFAPQLVADLPTDRYDVILDVVITD